jgi:hypothetical protein
MSDPYQSRVFTFITKRTNRLKDTCVRGLRHLKVAVMWTGQILLYPIHLLAQTTKIFQPQLPAPSAQKSLPQPAAEIDIEQALELVLESGYPILFQKSSANEIADSASLAVEDWSFVDENMWHDKPRNLAIFDSPPQRLHQREITYNSNDARQVKQTKPTIRGLSSLLIDRQIVLVTTENEILDILTTTQQQEIRRRIGLDLAIAWHQWRIGASSAKLSAEQLAADRELLLTNNSQNEWFSIDGENSIDPLLLSQSTANPDNRELSSPKSVDNPKESLRQRWQDWLRKFKPQPQSPPPQTSPESLQLPSAKYSFTPQPPKLDRFWDLPQLPPIDEDRATPRQDNIVLDSIAKLPPNWLKQWWTYYQEYLYIPSQSDSQIVHQPSEFKLTPIEPVPTKVKFRETAKKQDSLEIKSGRIPQEIYQDLEASQDWLEVDSELIGYSKSPLARLLAWLDRVMLQLENWAIKIWQKMMNNFARIDKS